MTSTLRTTTRFARFPQCEQQEIARAYRALMRTHHPDLDSGEAVPAELLRIMQAFAVLRDPGRRRAYDRSRAVPAARRNRRSADRSPSGSSPPHGSGRPPSAHPRPVGKRPLG